MPRVKLPNGKTASFPESMSMQDIQSAIESDPNSGALPAGATGSLPGVPTPSRNLNYVANIDSPTNLVSGAWSGIKNLFTPQTVAGMGQPFMASGMAPGGMYPTTAPMGMGDTGKTSLRLNTQAQGAAQQQQQQQGNYALGHPMETAGNVVGPALLTAGLAKALPKVGVPLEYVGGKMQEAGTGVINRTVGSLQKDFQRGTNPGQGYFQAGLGPSISMESIANKAAAAKAATGEQLGSLYEAATQSGTRIPVRDVSQAVSGPINRARSVITGPGGTGNVAPLEEFGASFRPPLQAGMDAGGMTPAEVFSMKRNVAENTTWNDPTQYNMNKVRQQTTGALGGLLTETLPETSPLNSQFQNLTALSRRAQLRAQTGSSPLTRLAAKVAYGTGGALLGSLHSPAAATGTALVGLAADSIPVRTTAASGLYYGGRGAVAMGKGLQGLFAPQPGSSPVSFAFDRAPARLEANVPGNAGYGEDFSQGNISPQNVYAPPAPATPLQLPASVPTGPVQPMVGIKASSYPPLATDYARTRVAPTRFSGPPENPFGIPKGYLEAGKPRFGSASANPPKRR
jgi:hypothetical protein